MILAKRTTNGDVIWMHRSVQRVESRGETEAVDDKFAADINTFSCHSLQFGQFTVRPPRVCGVGLDGDHVRQSYDLRRDATIEMLWSRRDDHLGTRGLHYFGESADRLPGTCAERDGFAQ